MRQYWEFQSYIPSVFGQIINFFVSILIDFGLEIVLRLYWRALPLKHCFWWGKVEMTLTAFLYRRCSKTHRAVERSEQAAALRASWSPKMDQKPEVKQCKGQRCMTDTRCEEWVLPVRRNGVHI